MKVGFDVNTVIYMYTNAPQQVEALVAYDVAILRGFEVYVPACSLADINYILHQCGLRGKKLDAAMDALFGMFDVFDANGQDGITAMKSGMKDFEDALIAASAARNGMDAIVTYNVKDFRKSPVPAMLPGQFSDAFKPANYMHEEIEWPPQDTK